MKVFNHYVPPSILIPEISITTNWGSAEGRRVENKVLCHKKRVPRVSPPHSLRYSVQTRELFMYFYLLLCCLCMFIYLALIHELPPSPLGMIS